MLTAAMLSATIFSMSNLSPSYANGITFKDMSNDFWGYENIQWAINNQVDDGYPDGTFKPNQYIEQSEFLAMLIRTYHPSDLVKSSDTNDWSNPYIQYSTK